MFDGPTDRMSPTIRCGKQGSDPAGQRRRQQRGARRARFYEGAMTAAGTFPSDATDQLVQANVVAARYEVAAVSIGPVGRRKAAPTGLQDVHAGVGTGNDGDVHEHDGSGGVERAAEPGGAEAMVGRRSGVDRGSGGGGRRAWSKDVPGDAGAGGLQWRPGGEGDVDQRGRRRSRRRRQRRRCGT